MKISKETIIRTVVLVIAMGNQLLAYLGKEAFPVTEEQAYQYITAAFTVGAALWSWWKNNSFTKEAIKADEVKDVIKDIGVDNVEVVEVDDELDEDLEVIE